MSAWDLPTNLTVGGQLWNIRSDYRAVLDIIHYFNDPNFEQDEKWMICLDILYEDFEKMPYELYNEAAKAATEFIDANVKGDENHRPVLMDWDKDFPLIVPHINRSIGKEVRSLSYLHWWTFVSAYMDISEGLFSTVVSIRSKLSEKKKLDKSERKFYNENRRIIDLKPQQEHDEEDDFWIKLLEE